VITLASSTTDNILHLLIKSLLLAFLHVESPKHLTCVKNIGPMEIFGHDLLLDVTVLKALVRLGETNLGLSSADFSLFKFWVQRIDRLVLSSDVFSRWNLKGELKALSLYVVADIRRLRRRLPTTPPLEPSIHLTQHTHRLQPIPLVHHDTQHVLGFGGHVDVVEHANESRCSSITSES